MALSENGGHSGGQFGNSSKTMASLRLQAIVDLDQAITSMKDWHQVSTHSALLSAVKDLTKLLSQLEEMPLQEILE